MKVIEDTYNNCIQVPGIVEWERPVGRRGQSMEENEGSRHPPCRPVDATDGLEREPKPVGEEGKVRPGE
jgi:hypothetical protein